MNFLEAKINDLADKINQIQKKPIIPEISPFINPDPMKNNNNIFSENIIIPPSPKVVIPAFNKPVITLEDSIHNNQNINNNNINNNNGFQVV